MCGIAGIISRRLLAPEDVKTVAKMNRAMIHRGPDGEGHYDSPHAALAMRRLSIIDLKGGQQPLYNEDRTVAVVANGEIYNYIELRAELEKRGHHFSTHSDCETIVHLYEDYGSRFVDHLRGMFAIALWDNRKQTLFLARDRMGEKPLYLYENGEQLLFASEMKGLLASGRVPFSLDPVSVDLFFHYNYVPEPRTILKGVRKLDAAHVMEIAPETWRIQESRYWNMEDSPPCAGDSATVLRAELERVSELVVRSDVPVGVALSGGLDSSVVAALTSRRYPGKMHAFCVGYPGAPLSDERADARKFADFLGIPFHEYEVTTEEMAEGFPRLVFASDDPVADISGTAYSAVMRMARRGGVPVLLQGQGGDELFWGYPWLRQSAAESEIKDALLRRDYVKVMRVFEFMKPRGYSPWQLRQWLEQGCGLRRGWERIRYYQESAPEQLVFHDLTPDFSKTSEVMSRLYEPSFNAQIAGSSATDVFKVRRPWRNWEVTLTRLISDTYLRGNGVVQGDRLGMAASVELRLPFLDHCFVEKVIGLRKYAGDSRLMPKAMLIGAVKDVIPDWVLKRPKRGFTPPVDKWYSALFVAHGASLHKGHLVQAGVLTEAVAADLATNKSPGNMIMPLSFKALVLETWCRLMVTRQNAAQE